MRGARFHLGKRYEGIAEPRTRSRARLDRARAGSAGTPACTWRRDDIEADPQSWNRSRTSPAWSTTWLHLHFERGLDQPACKWLLPRLNHEGWWMLLSNGNRDSNMESGFDDAVPFGKKFVAAAPDRLIWGAIGRMVNWRKSRMMNDAETVELL